MALKRINSGLGHSYKLDGRKCDGVTTLIGGGLPKPGLMYWSARAVAEHVADLNDDALAALRTLSRETVVRELKGVPWKRRDAAAVRGTEVHAYAEKLSRGERTDKPDHLAGHIESCVAFLDEWRISPVLTEVVVGSRCHGYAGTLDLIADLPDGRRALMDYKTSESGIWPETALQLAAYRYADFYLSAGVEIPMETVGVDCTYGVWLRADGYDVIPLNTGPEVFEMFRAVAYVARRIEGMKQWVGDAEEWAA